VAISLTTKAQPTKNKKQPTKKVHVKNKPQFIKVNYEMPSDSSHLIWYQTFKEEKFLESIRDALNLVFTMNKPLTLSAYECNRVNCFYLSEHKELIVCYEMLEYLRKTYIKYSNDEDTIGTRVGNAFAFILYHEVGHAIIDYFDLPVSGKEEDAADFFAFYMLGSNDVAEGVAACMEGAEFFKEMHLDMLAYTAYQRIYKEGKALDVLPFWDEHSFNLQRYYSIYSLIYGSNPEKYGYLVQQGKIGERRPIMAQLEFQKIKKSWNKLLHRHIKWKRE
jgi:hypothetical protein